MTADCLLLCMQVRIAALKREEDSLSKEKERLEAEKARHIRLLLTSVYRGCPF